MSQSSCIPPQLNSEEPGVWFTPNSITLGSGSQSYATVPTCCSVQRHVKASYLTCSLLQVAPKQLAAPVQSMAPAARTHKVHASPFFLISTRWRQAEILDFLTIWDEMETQCSVRISQQSQAIFELIIAEMVVQSHNCDREHMWAWDVPLPTTRSCHTASRETIVHQKPHNTCDTTVSTKADKDFSASLEPEGEETLTSSLQLPHNGCWRSRSSWCPITCLEPRTGVTTSLPRDNSNDTFVIVGVIQASCVLDITASPGIASHCPRPSTSHTVAEAPGLWSPSPSCWVSSPATNKPSFTATPNSQCLLTAHNFKPVLPLLVSCIQWQGEQTATSSQAGHL